MVDIGETESAKNIIISTNGKSANDIYTILKPILDQYKANLYCHVITTKGLDTVNTKYIYINNISYFKNISLIKGRFFNKKENESNLFISTDKTASSHQIGQIADFTGSNHFEIRTLKSNLNENIFNRNFVLQLANPSCESSLIEDVKNQGIYITDVTASSRSKDNTTWMIDLVIFVCLVALSLYVLYDILNAYKNIAIQKMLGVKNIRIWWSYLLSALLPAFTSMILCSFILILINFRTYNFLFLNFLFKLSIYYCLALFVSFLFISVPFLYIKKIRISNMIKNYRPTTEIIIFNTFLKTAMTIIFLILTVDTFLNYQLVLSRYNSSYHNWENTKNYAIIPEVQMKNVTNINDVEDNSSKMQQQNHDLYFYFNQLGSIYADFNHYSQGSASDAKKRIPDDITVNPNYLKQNVVYDQNGKIINISEVDEDYILLVPEKYKAAQHGIESYYQSIKSGYSATDEDSGANPNNKKSKVALEKIKIIWIKNGQKLFSYRLDINPKFNNCVADPIVRVLTKSNGDLSDYNVVLGYMGNPFKIRLSNPDSTTTITSKLMEYFDVTKYSFPIISVYDSIADQIQTATQKTEIMLITIILLCVLITIVTFQNILNYIEQNKVRLAIQKFHGYKIFDRYISYFYLLLTSWIIIISLSFYISQNNLVFLLAAVVAFADILASLILLSITEKKNILVVTKGG